MAKQGMHKNDRNDPRVSRGHNKPSQSTPITTGTPKKRKTYERQAREHQATNKQAQYAKNEWHDVTPQHLAASDRKSTHRRSGSDSNADSETRGY